MTGDFVLDCSVTMTWFFAHEASGATDELLVALSGGSTASVPQHWRLEVGNVLLSAERRNAKTRSDSEQFLTLLSALPIETDPGTDRRAHGQVVLLAREHRLTTYDAAYLDLALSRGVPLATLDRELRSAARKVGVKVLPERL